MICGVSRDLLYDKPSSGRFSPKILTEFFAKKTRQFYETPLSATNRRPKRRGSPKTRGTPKCYPLLFFKNGQPTNQETHNHKVNENHKTKHNLLIVRFSVVDICSKMQKLPLIAFLGKNSVKDFGAWVRTAHCSSG